MSGRSKCITGSVLNSPCVGLDPHRNLDVHDRVLADVERALLLPKSDVRDDLPSRESYFDVEFCCFGEGMKYKKRKAGRDRQIGRWTNRQTESS
jgi:hypothetical protein